MSSVQADRLELEVYQKDGEQQLKSGRPLVAYDILAEGLRQFPTDVRLRQLLALSLARTGAIRQAAATLEALATEGHADEETLGLLARTHKDLSAGSVDAGERRRHLEQAFASYRDAHQKTHGYWSGINAATLALLLDRRDEAGALARHVRDECLELLGSTVADQYWILATLGEAALILAEWSEAETRYSQAMAIAGRRLGDIASTRRNARLILRHLEIDRARIDACFRMPRVAVLVGHLVDRPDRPTPRFPPELEPAVRAAIAERLRRFDIGFGYASAACGSDILFHEALLEMNAEAHVVLPYDRDQFQADSVDLVPGSDWVPRYRRLLEEATEVLTASDQRMTRAGVSYDYASLVFDGMAAIRADELDTDLISLAVWDGRPGDGAGGTEATIARWRAAGRRVEIIDLRELAGHGGRESPRATPEVTTVRTAAHASGPSGFEPQVVSMLFADARGFSRLTDSEIPLFVEHFLGAVAAEVARLPNPPILKNTWGDGLYLVFGSVRDAGQLALRLCEVLEETEWASKGFSDRLSLRVGLHAGPAYACTDPVTGRLNYLGAHVSRAARIEPITPPGQVYASGAFAALAKAEGVRDLAFAYVGQMPLAKWYGTFPTYHVSRASGKIGELSDR